MNSKEKIKNDFIVILAIGLFLNYVIYLWFGSLDIIDELIFRVPEKFYMEFDLQIQFFVLVGTLIMFIAFIIEIIRVGHISLILLTILSIIQVIFAVNEFMFWLNPGEYSGIDYPILKIFLDFIQIFLLVVYLPKFRNSQRKGNRILKIVFILIFLGIAIVFMFIFTNFIFPVSYINTGISGPVNILLILVCCLMLLPGLIPIGILTYIQPVSQTALAELSQSHYIGAVKCPKCGTINDNNDIYCMECGFDINGLGI